MVECWFSMPKIRVRFPLSLFYFFLSNSMWLKDTRKKEIIDINKEVLYFLVVIYVKKNLLKLYAD